MNGYDQNTNITNSYSEEQAIYTLIIVNYLLTYRSKN